MRTVIQEKINSRYGSWTVLKFHRIDWHGDARWWCRCELCKEVYSVRGFSLRNGTTTMCKPCAIRRVKRDR